MDNPDPLIHARNPKIYSVSTLTEELKVLLEGHFDMVWVEGEISNFRVPSSGHYYMAMKDENARIRAVMFRPQTRYLKFMPEDGMKVIAQGRVTVYSPRGEYQLVLDYLEPLGVGALAFAFEQLKKKLASQGIFDEEIKKPLPFLPQKVAVITSPTGAAVRDFLNVIQRRFANIEIIVAPVKVQGDGAAEEIIDALESINRGTDVDVIVLTRGGGSLEDLWAFNEEKLALAIRASRIPVVSAVGHEIDVTISDLAADLRAPTPSAAAEILVAEKETLSLRLWETRDRLISNLKTFLANASERLALLSGGLRDPRRRIADSWLRLDELQGRIIWLLNFIIRERRNRLNAEQRALMRHSPAAALAGLLQQIEFHRRSLAVAMTRRLDQDRSTLSLLEEKIKDLSPYSVLKRGYSITRILPEKKILKTAKSVEKGEHVQILLSEGELECLVEKTMPEQD